jgi:hypothetical protein
MVTSSLLVDMLLVDLLLMGPTSGERPPPALASADVATSWLIDERAILQIGDGPQQQGMIVSEPGKCGFAPSAQEAAHLAGDATAIDNKRIGMRSPAGGAYAALPCQHGRVRAPG